jgi:hypothetical protein
MTEERALLKEMWLTTKELAAILRLAVNTLEQWRVRGQGPPFHYLGRVVRYFWPEVLDWICKKLGSKMPTTKAEMDATAKALEASVKGRVK